MLICVIGRDVNIFYCPLVSRYSQEHDYRLEQMEWFAIYVPTNAERQPIKFQISNFVKVQVSNCNDQREIVQFQTEPVW